MNPLIQAQINAAQKDAARVFDDNPVVDLDSRKIAVGRDFEIKISAPGNIVTAETVSNRPVEGPKLGQVKQSGSSVYAAPSTESWGKPPRG